MSATRPPAFDDRFTTPIEASRRGAHRARPKPVSTGVPIIAGVAVVLLVLGGAYAVVGGGGKNDSSNKSSLAAASALDNDPDATSTAKTSTEPTKTASPAPSSSSASSTSSSAAASTSSSSAGGNVNRSIELIVLNSVRVQGLAKRVQSSIQADGWTVQRTANAKSRNLSTTRIYYGKSATKATALALKKDLGFGTTLKDSGIVSRALNGTSAGLVVVLGQDAE